MRSPASTPAANMAADPSQPSAASASDGNGIPADASGAAPPPSSPAAPPPPIRVTAPAAEPLFSQRTVLMAVLLAYLAMTYVSELQGGGDTPHGSADSDGAYGESAGADSRAPAKEAAEKASSASASWQDAPRVLIQFCHG